MCSERESERISLKDGKEVGMSSSALAYNSAWRNEGT